MIYGYVRLIENQKVSEKQKDAVASFADERNLVIEKWIQAGRLASEKKLEKLKKGDVLIVPKLFRLGRDITSILTTLKTLLEREVTVYSAEDDLKLGNDIMASAMAYCFGLAADVAKENRVQLSKEGLDIVKESGKKLGRPNGAVNKQTLLSGKEKEVQKLLSAGTSVNRISQVMKVDRGTVRRFLRNHPDLMTECVNG